MDRIKNAYNAFLNKDPPKFNYGAGYGYRPDRVRLSRGNEKSIVSSIYTRIAIDCAAITVKHVRLDENERYIEDIDSGLNSCLTVSANIDQTSRAFLQDLYMSLLDEGSVAIVPVDTDKSITKNSTFDILSMRVGKVTQWYPENVTINLYNDNTGQKEDITLPKRSVCIIENPLYAVMNEGNSTLQRLIHKLNLLDAVDEQSSSGKLDLIIQLPYVVKTDARKLQAEQRRKDIETQLSGSKYGIAYTDGTEKITQLNRSLTNNLMEQIEYLTKTLYNQLGMTQEIFDGTADENKMLNYYNRTIEPIISAVVDEMKRKFLTKTARSQRQSIIFFRSPFKLVPVNDLAEIADKFTRNEILTSNEVRQLIGYKPSDNPDADQLRNKNLNASDNQIGDPSMEVQPEQTEYDTGQVYPEEEQYEEVQQ